MVQAAPERATLADLVRTPGQAELIGGRIVTYPPFGFRPGCVAARIALALHDVAEANGWGEAFTATFGYAVPELRSGRQSFCADASYYDGPLPSDPMGFIEGPPTLAVEIRSEDDFTPSAEAAMAAKRADYFEAGTLVVWDVDPVNDLIRVYRRDEPTLPTTYGRGVVAEAEPALPGWRVAVDDLLDVP